MCDGPAHMDGINNAVSAGTHKTMASHRISNLLLEGGIYIHYVDLHNIHYINDSSKLNSILMHAV